MNREADVVVVGAGLSGLIAARKILDAGYEPLVIEANDRIGGRIDTRDIGDGIYLELGAQWIGDTHDRVRNLASSFDIQLYEQFEDGETSYEIGGPVLRESEFYQKHASDLEAWEQTLADLDVMAAEVPATAPWQAAKAVEWDELTIAQWAAAQNMTPIARRMFEICTVGIFSAPCSEISLLELLVCISSCGVGSALFSEDEGGAQTTRFAGGTSLLPQRLAATLGDRIVLNSPAMLIEHGDGGVTVTCRGGLIARGKQVIVALSPTMASRIMYDPPLPAMRDQMTQRSPQGSAMKCFVVYDEPFWRADGLNGQMISEPGPACMSNDSCMPDAGAGIILCFLEGAQARTFGRWPEERRREALFDQLSRHFGKRAAKPELYVEGEWASKQWTRGCYNDNFGPNTWTQFGQALAAPIGAIKWAATETADYWPGYMEGAVDAGERAAREVLEALDTKAP